MRWVCTQHNVLPLDFASARVSKRSQGVPFRFTWWMPFGRVTQNRSSILLPDDSCLRDLGVCSTGSQKEPSPSFGSQKTCETGDCFQEALEALDTELKLPRAVRHRSDLGVLVDGCDMLRLSSPKPPKVGRKENN